MTLHYIKLLYMPLKCSTVQHSTVDNSEVQHITVEYITVTVLFSVQRTVQLGSPGWAGLSRFTRLTLHCGEGELKENFWDLFTQA